MLFVLMVALMVIVVLTRDSIKKIFQTKCKTASVAPVTANEGRPGVFLKHDLTKHILEGFVGDPVGMRQLSAAFSGSYITVCRVLL